MLFCCFIIGFCFIMFLLLSVCVVCLTELNERCLVLKVVSKGHRHTERHDSIISLTVLIE